MSATEKNLALSVIANGADVSFLGKAKYRISSSIVHVRFCSQNARTLEKYKFNINPNTLSADYELWICGSAAMYYLIPVSIMQKIYNDPNAYEDRHHPRIKVVSVDTSIHTVTYATGGINTSLSQYFNTTM
jgi:hypothetical protein